MEWDFRGARRPGNRSRVYTAMLFFGLGLAVLDATTRGDAPAFRAPTVLYYYANWCHHCQEFAPVFGALEDAYALRGSRLAFARFDCMRNARLCEAQGVGGYPFVVLALGDGRQVLFRLQKRTAKVLSLWIDKQLEVSGVAQ